MLVSHKKHTLVFVQVTHINNCVLPRSSALHGVSATRQGAYFKQTRTYEDFEKCLHFLLVTELSPVPV
jgi:hypothetical protein